MIYEKYREVLLRECELVISARTVQDKIRESIANQEWTDFEGHFKFLNAIESGLTGLELERNEICDEFEAEKNIKVSAQTDAKGRFYALVSHLCEKERNELSAVYRNLKLEVLKLKMANEALMAYLIGIRTTINDFISLAFPERAGKTYTKNGSHFSHDMRSIVLNRNF
jgi:hypothetical protein